MNDTAQAPSQQIARRPTNFEIELANYEPQFQSALPAHIPLDRFKRTVVTAINANPELMKADRRSLFLSCVRAAQDGLFPDGREAALVIFSGKDGKIVQYMPMVAGIIKRMRNSGDVASVDTQIVHENDAFAYRLGDDPHIAHTPTLGEPGKVICAYAIIKLTNGEVLREVMSVADIEKVRKVSRAANNGPWVTWWDQMARKTVLRRCSKRAPVSSDLEAMLQRDDEAALGRGRDGEALVDTPPRPSRADFTDQAPRIENQPEPEPDFEIIDVPDGQVTGYRDPKTAAEAFIDRIGLCVGREALAALWENNTLSGQLRDRGHAALADLVKEAYVAAEASFARKVEPDAKDDASNTAADNRPTDKTVAPEPTCKDTKAIPAYVDAVVIWIPQVDIEAVVAHSDRNKKWWDFIRLNREQDWARIQAAMALRA